MIYSLDESLSLQLCIFIIDLSNSICKQNKNKFIIDENSIYLIELCKKYSSVVVSSDENFSKILFENLNILLNNQ